MESPSVEKDCTIELQGKKFTSGGAFLSESHIIGYCGKDGILTTWHGEKMGTWKAVSTWKTPRSFVFSTMSQIEARVNGMKYTGRGAGEGMIFRGKRKVSK